MCPNSASACEVSLCVAAYRQMAAEFPGIRFLYVGRDSSVGTATHYGLDGPGIESYWGRDKGCRKTGHEASVRWEYSIALLFL